jgi:hypothetical protein
MHTAYDSPVRRRFDDWYRSVPTYGDPLDALHEVNRVGGRLADELAAVIGQPVAYG